MNLIPIIILNSKKPSFCGVKDHGTLFDDSYENGMLIVTISF